MKTALELFDEFMIFRETFIDESLKSAFFKESRGDSSVRPVGIIETEHDLRLLNVKLARWQLYAKQIIALDPIRFNEVQKAFAPMPVVLHNKEKCLIRCFEAVSSRLRSRQGMIRDLKTRLHGLMSQTDPIYTNEIVKTRAEIAFYMNETEENYRIRSIGYPETLIMHSDIGCKSPAKKLRVPMAGVFIYNPNGETYVELPKGEPTKSRKHSFSLLGCKPLPPSRNIRGTVYRVSDLEKAKEKARLKKLASAGGAMTDPSSSAVG